MSGYKLESFDLQPQDLVRWQEEKRNFEKFCSDQITAKPFKSRSTEHGIYYEPIAKREYQKYMEKIGHPVSVKQSGFCLP